MSTNHKWFIALNNVCFPMIPCGLSESFLLILSFMKSLSVAENHSITDHLTSPLNPEVLDHTLINYLLSLNNYCN